MKSNRSVRVYCVAGPDLGPDQITRDSLRIYPRLASLNG